jgi:hypothetical protein
VPNLKGDARLDWHKFNDNLLTIARQTVRAQTGGTGLLGYLLPNAMWITFPANIRADGTIIPVFDVITPIEVPPNNANNAVVKFWEKSVLDREAILAAREEFTHKLINSLPSADISVLSDARWGMLNVTAAQIYAHIQPKYSVLNATDFDSIYMKLNLPKSATEDFEALSDRHRALHAICATAAQPISELEKCRYYKAALSTNPAGSSATHHYTQLTPLLANQTFADLVTHVELHAPNFITTAASLGYASAAAVSSTAVAKSSAPSSEAALAAQIAQLQRELSTLHRNPNGGQRPNQSHGAQRQQQQPRSYCFFHGYGHHPGSKCKTMLANSTLYGPDRLNATEPHNPPGGNPVVK